MQTTTFTSNIPNRGASSLTACSQFLVINVGGVRFQTYKSSLKLMSKSRLANLSPASNDYDPVRNEYFFDRDPSSFEAILNFFRTGQLHVPNTVCGNRFFEELSFWTISESSIQSCCWTGYSNKRECESVLKQLAEDRNKETVGK